MSDSLCDHCGDPGRCCHDFALLPSPTFWEDEPDAVGAWLTDQGLPFIPLRPAGRAADEHGRAYIWYRFACPHLQGGRCGIYADRPEICRRYEPASDQLCTFAAERWFFDIKKTREDQSHEPAA